MSQQAISRRELLKLLAAATGVAALSTIPNQWVTPIVEIGALPAHAQASLAPGAISGTIKIQNVTSPDKASAPNPLALLTVGTTNPIIIAGVISPPTNNIFPYLISPVPPGNNYTVSCTWNPNACPTTQTHSPVTVNPGATTPNINFDFTLLAPKIC